MGVDPYAIDGWHDLTEYSSRLGGDGPAGLANEKPLEIEEAADIFWRRADRGGLWICQSRVRCIFFRVVQVLLSECTSLKSRHIQFLALGGTIGTGLFLGVGRAFTQAGQLSLLLGYTFTGIAIYAMMMSLGEMATWLPLPGAIPQFCARYVDPAMGFAVGWNVCQAPGLPPLIRHSTDPFRTQHWYQASICLCAEISAASVVIQFWNGARDINVAAWISPIIVLIVLLNIFAVHIYGESEFIFSSIKLITIIGLLIFALIVDLGGGPKHERLGFRYWKDPGAMKAFVATGSPGRFLGPWSTLVNAAFSYGGVEMVAVAAGEAENPRVNIPKAVRRVFWRILLFYVLGSLAIGVLIPYDDTQLLNAQRLGKFHTAASPWVIAAKSAAVPVLPSIINAVTWHEEQVPGKRKRSLQRVLNCQPHDQPILDLLHHLRQPFHLRWPATTLPKILQHGLRW